jgi:predicted DNA-binding transcriptional regulator AlpA
MEPLTVNTETAAQVLGISTWALYQAANAGTCPIEPIRIGRRLVWSKARLAELLGIDSIEPFESSDAQSDGNDEVAGQGTYVNTLSTAKLTNGRAAESLEGPYRPTKDQSSPAGGRHSDRP